MKHQISSVAELKTLLSELWRGGINTPLTIEIKSIRGNSWPMKKTWRMWMRETADFMSGNGVTMPLGVTAEGVPWGKRPFNDDDAHELWVRHWMGVDSDGARYKTASGDKGEMVSMMDKHSAWAADKGLFLTIPQHGEYMKYREAQQ